MTRLRAAASLLFVSAALGTLILPACDPSYIDGVVQPDGGVCHHEELFCGERCVSVKSDPAHCGGCGHACAQGKVCSEGECADACDDSHTDCDGACIDTRSDPEHCGGCESACAEGIECKDSACGCEGELERCEGACVDVKTDPLHCGSCDKPCGQGESCSDGNCE